MPVTPTKVAQWVWGMLDTNDILHIYNDQGTLVSWIDGNGFGQGNLASGATLGTFTNNEVVTVSGTSFGPLLHLPNGQFFMLSKNGQILNSSTDYTLTGQSGTLVVSAQAGDIYTAWYTH